MATGKSGTLTWTSGSYAVQVTWSETYEVSTNQSTVSITSVKAKAAYYGVSYYPDGVIKINGTTVLTMDSRTPTGSVHINALNNYYDVSNTSCSLSGITHSTDGTKSINIELAGNRFNKFAFYTSSGEYGSGWGVTGSQSITLTTIPRAASISSASNITLGNACSVSWTPASSSFRYKLKFKLGSWEHTIGAIHPNKTSSYTYSSYTIPLDVANQLPSATSGTMTAYLYTYSDSGCTTQIGSTTSKTFTVTVPSTIVPTLGTVSATIVNTNSIINGWGVAVAGYTKVNVSATASGSYGSTISSFTISGGYSTTQNGTSLNYTGGVISSSGSKTFTVVAKDSRSRSSASKSATAITFYAYSNPTVSSFTVARSSSNAKKVIVKANWTFSSVNSKNAATATLYYKKSSNTSWTTYGTIAKNTNVTLTNDFEETSSYNFKVVVTDSLSNSAQEEGFISTIEVTMDFRAGGKGMGIGKIAETDNLEIAFDTIFMGNVYIQSDDGTKVSLADYIRSLI